jgi:hypothetical protein
MEQKNMIQSNANKGDSQLLYEKYGYSIMDGSKKLNSFINRWTYGKTKIDEYNIPDKIIENFIQI